MFIYYWSSMKRTDTEDSRQAESSHGEKEICFASEIHEVMKSIEDLKHREDVVLPRKAECN